MLRVPGNRVRNGLLITAERVLMLVARYSTRLANASLKGRGLTETQFIVVVSPKVRNAVEVAAPYVRAVDGDRGKDSDGKMLRVLRRLRKIPLFGKLEGSQSAKRGWKPYTNKSQLRWIAETAIQIREGRLRLVG